MGTRAHHRFAVLQLAAAGLIALASSALAGPSAELPHEIVNADGTRLRAVTRGDEWRHSVETEDGFAVAKGADGNWYYATGFANGAALLHSRRATEPPPAGIPKHLRPAAAPGAPSGAAALALAPTGDFTGRVLFILVEFTNVAGSSTEDYWSSLRADKLAPFYDDASNGRVSLVPAQESFGTADNGVVGWLNLGRNHPNTAGRTDRDNQRLTRDAVLAADPYVDFASFDTDGNGYLNGSELAVVVVAAGFEESYSGNFGPSVWAHAWNVSWYAPPVVDGVTVASGHDGGYDYLQIGEKHQHTAEDGHTATVGVLAHELGHHVFGLPDLYDTDGSSRGIDGYDLMSYGSWGQAADDLYFGTTPVLPSAWCKLAMGWVDASEGTGVQGVKSHGESSDGSATVFRVSTSVPTQYFLVENRQDAGYDRGMERFLGAPFAGGIAIWHIDETVATNAVDTRRKVDLEEADAVSGAANTDLWYEGNKRAFHDGSIPNSRLYSGASTTERIEILAPPLVQMDVLFSDAATCTGPDTAGLACSDGFFCNGVDLCAGGSCSDHPGDPCADGPECASSCNDVTESCIALAGIPCSGDGVICTEDHCDGAGACIHPVGNAGAPCRIATGICDSAETCTGSSTSCPGDLLKSSTTVCRAPASVCDAAERCTGASFACPADSPAPTTLPCRAQVGACDAAESCDGIGFDCPADALAGTTTVCRTQNGVCDVAETCTGSATSCPANALAPSSQLCRAVVSVCDVSENCTGSIPICPVDGFAEPTTVCRVATGVCDVTESCNGNSPTCPADFLTAIGSICRASSTVCDAAESCTGKSDACPVDVLASSSAVCRTAGGPCDAVEHCDGSTTLCPADLLAGTSTVCRIAAGACDLVESCTGASAGCPANLFEASGVVCRADAGVCDLAELCSGTSAPCPPNDFESAALVCRAATGACDAVEACSGSSAGCPADLLRTSNAVCRAATGGCDEIELCSGAGDECPPDVLRAAATVCRAVAGVCDIAETCSGSDDQCPGDSRRPSDSVCRASTGACDAVELCNGAGTTCPPNAVLNSTTVCRPMSGACDAVERCSGTSPSCPADLYQTTEWTCRSASGACDSAERCSGSGAACPADALATSATICRASAGICDQPERCDGEGDSCPADVFATSSSVCRAASGVCDAAETCAGTGPLCPGDAVAGTAKVCRTATQECDATESCSGSSKSCPANAFRGAGSVCTADTNPCTNDVCNGSGAACTHPANALPCDDGDECTIDDQCSGGTCDGDFNPACGTTTTTLLDTVCGDPNGDGRITTTDALVALRTAVGPDECGLEVCDYTGDGQITVTDALAILRKAVGQPTTPMCPESSAPTTIE